MDIDQLFDEFIEFPDGSNGKYVTTVSAKLFAKYCVEQMQAEVERLQLQLAACGVVAMANTPESAARQRDMHPDYMSASCQDVIRAVDREMTLREERDQLKDQLYKYGCEDVDVIRCLKTLAYEHNHSDVPRYKDLAKRTMDKYMDRCTSAGSTLAARDAEVIETWLKRLPISNRAVRLSDVRKSAQEYADQLRQQAKEVQP